MGLINELISINFRYHQLKLYPEEESGPQTTKKPVVMETYDEIVFSDPYEQFVSRIQNHPIAVLPRLPAGVILSPGIFLWNYGFGFRIYGYLF